MPKKKKTKKTGKADKKTAAKKKPAKKKVKTAAKKRTVGRTRKKPGDRFQGLAIINEKLQHLETQAVKAYECVQAIKKRSAPDWKEWVDKLSHQDWLALADAQRERITLEVKHLSDEILSRIHESNVISNKDGLLKDAKKSLEGIVSNIEKSDLVKSAIDTALHTKEGVMAFLNIPTHEEMAKLQKKLIRIEKKMTDLKPARRR